MAVTIVVLSGRVADVPELSLTLDMPRIVIGRSEGCEVRLPDASVSARHASLRQRGGEYLLFDENSNNGTFLGPVRLPPHAPRAVRSGEQVRVGRVWLEVRIAPAVVRGSTAAAAKDLALALVTRGLASQGIAPDPCLTVKNGLRAGKALHLESPERWYVIGRRPDADLVLDDDSVGTHHARIMRKGDALLVRAEGSYGCTELEGQTIVEATWKVGQVLRMGRIELDFDYPAAAALAELERAPDETMVDEETSSPPSASDKEAAEPLPEPSDNDPTPIPPHFERAATTALSRNRPIETPGWGVLDSAVVLLALSVLAVSLLGAWWLLGR